MRNPKHPGTAREVRIPSGAAWLHGDLVLPPGAPALVLFAHGGGSGRHSARNRLVAQRLQQAGIGTLLFDMLTAQEDQVDSQTRQHRFDIPLMTQRMQDATTWAESQPDLQNIALGYYGASTGAAAALIAAARLGDRIRALVSRGGRPDLAGAAAVAAVTAPTMFIVGGADQAVLALNKQAHAQLQGPSRLVVVPGAGHLFEEPGALDQVAQVTALWFSAYLLPVEQQA